MTIRHQAAPNPIGRVSSETLNDLRRRIEATRFVPGVPAVGSELGAARSEVAELLRYWADHFDWRAHEARIIAYPWVQSTTEVPVNAIVRRGAAESSPAVLLLHGWPDSVLRFERLLARETNITWIVPALPGFPFSATQATGMSAVEIADVIHSALEDLGFSRYIVSAGDVGCDVGEALAARHPEAVQALHLTDVSQFHFLGELPDDLDETERSYVAYGRHWQATEGGYMHEQRTRPNTVAMALGDSPAGLIAWIGEKLERWVDADPALPPAFSIDEYLTWVTAYWVTGTIGTSFAPYALNAGKPWKRIEAPTVFTIFPKDLVNAPRRFAERHFRVVEWREFAHGGHFAAWERPSDYLWGVRRAIEAASER